MTAVEALAAVASALLSAGRSRADSILAEAEAEGRAAVAAARAEGREEVTLARKGGLQAVERVAAARLGLARREARQAILSAHRSAYDELRGGAVKVLQKRLDSPEGRACYDFLVEQVSKRAGGATVTRRDEPDGWVLEAGSDGRRAELRPALLVDQVLASMGPELNRP